MGHPVLSIARTDCRHTWVGSDSDSVDESSGPGAQTDCGDLVRDFWSVRVLLRGNHVPYEAIAEKDEALDSEEVYVRFGEG